MRRSIRRYKLLRIVLKNFRVYGEETTIEFGTDDDKRITIIEGSNGTGKTTLLNAITWCLYGKELHLPPISRSKKEYEIRPNLYRIRYSSDDKIEVSVELMFGDDEGNPICHIQRKEYYERLFNSDINRVGEEFTIRIRDNNNWKIINEKDIFLTLFLPESIHEFYFFDGEQLDEFFRDIKSKDKVKKAIEKLSQIELLDRAIKHLEDTKKEVYRSLKTLSPQTEQKRKELDEIDREIQNIEERLKNNKEEEERIQQEIRKIEDELNEIRYEEIKELVNKRNELQYKLTTLEDKLKETVKESIEHLIKYTPFVYCKNTITELSNQINKMANKGDLPPKIKQEFVNELLQKGICICGTPLLPNSPQRSTLEEYRKNISPDKLSTYILENRILIKNILNNIESFGEKRRKYGVDISSLEDDIEQINRQLKGISDKLSDESMPTKIRELEQKRKELDSLKSKLEKTIGWDESELDRKKNDKKKLEKELNKEIEKEENSKKVTFQYRLCDEAIDQLTQIKNDLINTIRTEVTEKTNQYFINLIWKKDSFSHINIDEDYDISVYGSDNTDRLGVLSAGEREVLTLSFIAALRDVIDIRLPIIMDTPLARISGEPRKNIAQLLPNYLSDTQLILLLTDQEYTSDIRELLKNYVGKELVLRFDKDKQQTFIEKRKDKI